MTQSSSPPKSWLETIESFKRPSVIKMLFLGFSAGMPILLIFSSLSIWLREAGVSRSDVTFFSWAALGYSFKFVWAPLVDQLPLPFLTKRMGRRRSWLLLSQISVAAAMFFMALTDPASSEASLKLMALAAVMLGFSSATQDIVIDAYRIECDSQDYQALLASTYSTGYRVAMILASAGALYLAEALGTSNEQYKYSAWMWTYVSMGLIMTVGMVTTLVISEPTTKRSTNLNYHTQDYVRFLLYFLLCVGGFVLAFSYIRSFTGIGEFSASVFGKVLGKFITESVTMIGSIALAFICGRLLLFTGIVNRGMVSHTYVEPVKDFFDRYKTSLAVLLLCLIGFYRISDIVLGVISNVFYTDLGFSKSDIATVSKTFGVIMTLLGTFLGGVLSVRYGLLRILFWGAVLSAGSNLLFMLLAQIGNNVPVFYLVVMLDNLAAGIASAAFIAFLSSLTNISFTAVQYAIFSSLMTLFPKLLGGYSGTIVDTIGYKNFFLFTTLLGIPVLLLVWLAGKKLEHQDQIT